MKIDVRLLSDAKRWNVKRLHVYALSSSTIGISPNPIKDWQANALHYERVDCIRTPKSIQFKLPTTLYNFYRLVQPDVRHVLSGIFTGAGNAVLMTVERVK